MIPEHVLENGKGILDVFLYNPTTGILYGEFNNF